MSNFLGKLRRKEMKGARYLKYAVGEILLVVIGILIALSVNNFNTKRVNKQKEKVLLQQLEKDITLAVNDLSGNIDIQDQSIYSANFVLKHMDSGKPYEDSVAFHLGRAFLWSKLIIDLGAFENIKSTGLDIITNQDLRNEIVNNLSGKLGFHQHFENLIVAYSEEIRSNVGVKYFVSSYEGIGFKENGLFWGKTVPRDYEVLRVDPEFRYHLKSFLSLNQSFQKFEHRNYKSIMEKLLVNIQSELQGL